MGGLMDGLVIRQDKQPSVGWRCRINLALAEGQLCREG